MSEASGKLTVDPAALQGASGIIGGQATPLASSSGAPGMSTETAGLAGAALDRAVDGYCPAFAERLSAVAAGLVGAAGSYTATEATNSDAIAAVAPVEAM